MDKGSTLTTIAVITCNRPTWLKRLLLALSKQVASDSTQLDILVVDNACDPATEKVVSEINTHSAIPVTYQTEPVKGIVAARNRCVTHFLATESQNLIFIDDDEWPSDEHWAQNLIDKKQHYQADIMTSHVISVGEEGTPEWAVDLIYGKNPLVEGDQITTYYTNNLLISRHVLEQISPAFDMRFAMTGASDYHFALKCTQAGFKAFYTDAPVIEEFPKSRATIKWFLRRGFRSGIGYTRSHLFEESKSTALMRCLFMAGVRFARGILYCLKGIVTLNKTTFVDGMFRFCSFGGTIAGFFGIKHEEYNTIHGK
ncbi:glycosyltransferase [Thalassotalea sp. PLHSN55]|uniref:glycosyltransferase n=1 Tax=Thalassotalea sp. PLHSN55 TaxID=3435888 RepID=UPI003F83BAD3